MAAGLPFRSRWAAGLFGLALLLVAVAPMLSRSRTPGLEAASPEPAWPHRIEGRAVRELPLSNVERRFAAEFPGRIKRLTDGRRIFILRWVTRATRKLHPASDCFRGLGYAVKPGGGVIGPEGREWGTFTATGGGVTLHVTERIWDAAGNSWPDAPAWFWAAALGRTHGPWWAMTVAQ